VNQKSKEVWEKAEALVPELNDVYKKAEEIFEEQKIKS
jgi:hypothetical protein